MKMAVLAGKWIVELWKSIAKVVVRLGDRTRFSEREREVVMYSGAGARKGQSRERKAGLNSGKGSRGDGLEDVSVELESLP